MARKRINLSEDVDKLVNKYLEMTNCSMDELTNKALHFYIAKQLGSKEVRRALKQRDPEDFKYLDEMSSNYMHNNWDF